MAERRTVPDLGCFMSRRHRDFIRFRRLQARSRVQTNQRQAVAHRAWRSLRFKRSELLLEGLDFEQISSHIMITATLMRDETKVPFRIVTARASTAEMDDCGQVLFLLERRRLFAEDIRHLTVEERGSQLDCVTWNDSGVKTVEPARVEVVPRSGFDDDMVVDTIALRFLKRAIGNLEHPDRGRGWLIPLEGI